MINGIKVFLNSLIKVGPHLYGLYKKGCQDEKIIELLECYYIMRDLIDTADDLLKIAHGKTEIVFSDLSKKELEDNFILVQAKLTIQLQRLHRLKDLFLSNPTIDLLDSEIKEEFLKALGSKGEGLYTIGAGLFFNQMFGSSGKENENEETRLKRVVEEQYDFTGAITGYDQISISEQSEIFNELKQLRIKYLESIKSVLNPEHKLLFASKGKELAEKYGVRM